MSLKIECNLKGNVTQNKWNVTQNGMSLKMQCPSKWNIIQNEISLKMYSNSNGMSQKKNVTQNGISIKMECHANKMSLKIDWHSK